MRGALSHIDLNVTDAVSSSRFYGVLLGHLGFEQRRLDDAGRTEWSLTYPDLSRFGIEVRPPRHHLVRDRHERYAPGLDHFALQAASRSEVDELAQLLTEAGFVVDDPPRQYDYSPGYYALALDDPDGIRIEVVHSPVRDTTPVPVDITHLVMSDRPDLDLAADTISLGRVPTAMPTLNRFFYTTVGAEFCWHSRLQWSTAQWSDLLNQAGHETWIATSDSVPIGYCELLTSTDGPTVEIYSFGLLPSFIGEGLGPQLLRGCLAQAWRDDATIAVKLNTCSLDHPRALPNYLAAGFEVERTERIVDQIPRHML